MAGAIEQYYSTGWTNNNILEEKSILRNRERKSRLRRVSRDEQSVLLPGFVLRPDGD